MMSYMEAGSKDPGWITLFDEKGSVLTEGNFYCKDGEGRTHRFTGMQVKDKSDPGFSAELGSASGLTAALTVGLASAEPAPGMSKTHHLVLRLTVSGGCAWAGMECRSYRNDHFLGFGERFDCIDQKGKEVDLWVTNGANGGVTYKPVPFFMTPRGYGIAAETSNRILCRMAAVDGPGFYSVQAESETLILHIFTAPDLKDILSLYTQFIGRSAPPEAWVYGPWKSRDWKVENQETVSVDITKQRELDLAGTVKLIDASWQNEYNDFSFHRTKFREPLKMFRDAEEKGYKIVLWVSPFMHEGTGAFREAQEKGYLAQDASGGPKLTRLGNDPDFRGAVFDFTNPQAAAWWKGRLKALMEMGAGGFKTDFGEQVDEDALFFDGRTGKELHNLFPVLYNRAAWEVVKEYGGVLLGRSAWAGSQEFHGVWAGDQTADFCRWSGLPSAVTAGITAGLSGFYLWGSDIGGYFSGPDKQVFVRWIQFGTFSPVMQIHGMGEHDPWNFDDETLRIYRAYADLRMRLLPYILGCADEYRRSGLPLLRGLPLYYADDAEVFENLSAQYEYMFGPNILAAPICFNGDGRSIYLPEGEWTDWWTGEIHEGGKKFWFDGKLEVIPLFIRSGSLIPLFKGGISTTLAVNGRIPDYDDYLSLECYPSRREAAAFSVENLVSVHLSAVGPDGILSLRIEGLRRNQSCRIAFMGFDSGTVRTIRGGSVRDTGMVDSAVSVFSPFERKNKGWYLDLDAAGVVEIDITLPGGTMKPGTTGEAARKEDQ